MRETERESTDSIEELVSRSYCIDGFGRVIGDLTGDATNARTVAAGLLNSSDLGQETIDGAGAALGVRPLGALGSVPL